MQDDKAKAKPEGKQPAVGGVQGEGDYASAREYRRETEDFVAKRGKDIPGLAKDAEKALDGKEGGELKRAEEAGKAKAKH